MLTLADRYIPTARRRHDGTMIALPFQDAHHRLKSAFPDWYPPEHATRFRDRVQHRAWLNSFAPGFNNSFVDWI